MLRRMTMTMPRVAPDREEDDLIRA